MDVMEQLNQIFCEVFDDQAIKINHETIASDVDGWDSLSHVNLILAVEMRFKVKFAQWEIRKFANVGDLHKCLVSKLQKLT